MAVPVGKLMDVHVACQTATGPTQLQWLSAETGTAWVPRNELAAQLTTSVEADTPARAAFGPGRAPIDACAPKAPGRGAEGSDKKSLGTVPRLKVAVDSPGTGSRY